MRRCARREDRGREPAKRSGQTYAVDYIRQQVIAAVGWDRAINEGYRIHTTIDVNLQRAAEDSLKAHLERAEQHPDYIIRPTADYAASFRKAKASGKMAEQPAPEYLQGAAIGLDTRPATFLCWWEDAISNTTSLIEHCKLAGLRARQCCRLFTRPAFERRNVSRVSS